MSDDFALPGFFAFGILGQEQKDGSFPGPDLGQADVYVPGDGETRVVRRKWKRPKGVLMCSNCGLYEIVRRYRCLDCAKQYEREHQRKLRRRKGLTKKSRPRARKPRTQPERGRKRGSRAMPMMGLPSASTSPRASMGYQHPMMPPAPGAQGFPGIPDVSGPHGPKKRKTENGFEYVQHTTRETTMTLQSTETVHVRGQTFEVPVYETPGGTPQAPRKQGQTATNPTINEANNCYAQTMKSLESLSQALSSRAAAFTAGAPVATAPPCQGIPQPTPEPKVEPGIPVLAGGLVPKTEDQGDKPVTPDSAGQENGLKNDVFMGEWVEPRDFSLFKGPEFWKRLSDDLEHLYGMTKLV